jgi:hypothetical protein
MDLYGALLFQVTSQQLSVAATRRTLARIEALFEGHLPSPAALLAINPAPLREAGLSWRKVTLPTQPEVLAIADTWRPHRSLATSYLFSAAFDSTEAPRAPHTRRSTRSATHARATTEAALVARRADAGVARCPHLDERKTRYMTDVSGKRWAEVARQPTRRRFIRCRPQPAHDQSGVRCGRRRSREPELRHVAASDAVKLMTLPCPLRGAMGGCTGTGQVGDRSRSCTPNPRRG